MKSLSWKIFLGFILIVLTFSCLVLYISYDTVKQNYLDVTVDKLNTNNEIIVENVKRLLSEDDIHSLKSYVVNISKKSNSTLWIIDDLGYVVVGSDYDLTNSKNLRNEDDVKFLIDKPSLNRYHLIDNDYIYVSTLFENNSDKFIVRSMIRNDKVGSLDNLLHFDILLILMFLVIFSIVFVIFFNIKVIKPIRSLTRASRKVALGDFDNKVLISGNDELFHLASNFNQMTSKLKDYFVLAESQQQQFLSLISSLQASLIVIDKNGQISLHNKSFENLSKSSLVKGRMYWEILPALEFSALIKSLENKKKHITKEIELYNNLYLCSANYIESKSEVVVLFHDITEIKKLENIKRDFVVNVTHELRTPLTAIKGFIETLQDDIGEDDVIANYVSIIKRHTERLINIVQDLLTLSEVEQKNSLIQKSKIDIHPLVDSIVRVFDQKVKSKGLQLISEIDPLLPKLKIDPFRIEQVLINLIDNAIKYTDSGFVKISIDKVGSNVRICVEDSGVGIPKEHHNRLFERFYTVDKSRSRKVGGTGLGLAIVKHIVILHEGEISVESGAVNGTKFIILIPQKHFNMNS